MDFALSAEQEMFRSSVRKYLDSVGQTKIARAIRNGQDEPFHKVMQGLADLGCSCITVPEEFDGADLGSLDLVPVLEEIGRALLPGLYLETVAFAVPLIKKYGTQEQKEKYLSEIASGKRMMTLAWLEPNQGYAPGEVEMAGKIDGDHLSINGIKTLVPEGDQADTLIVLVRTKLGNDVDGLSLVFVDRTEQGLEYRNQRCFDETKHLTEIVFNNVTIPIRQILGPMDHGWTVLQEGLLHLNAALTSVMVGGMERIVTMCAEYANIRMQFGQPIGRFQAIKHRIVDMKLDLETSRSLSYHANWALEGDLENREAAINSARAFITEAFLRIAGQSIQIHGGIGVTEEIDCHLYVKRAKYYENYLGSIRSYQEKAALALNW